MRSRRVRSLLLRLPATVAALAVVAAPGLGCGTEVRDSRPRPPIPIGVDVIVGTTKVRVSPTEFGAGETTFTVVNRSGGRTTVEIAGQGVSEEMGPVDNGDVTTTNVTLEPGTYELKSLEDIAVAPARIVVGPERPSAQNRLLLP